MVYATSLAPFVIDSPKREVFKLNLDDGFWLPEVRVNRMDLEDRRIRREKPKIKCHERKTNRPGTTTYRRKTSGKTKYKCPDKGSTKIQKPAQINPLMTVLMSTRSQFAQTTGDVPTTSVAAKTPSIAYRTVVLELPEDVRYKPAAKKSLGGNGCKSTIRKCIVPNREKSKLCLRW